MSNQPTADLKSVCLHINVLGNISFGKPSSFRKSLPFVSDTAKLNVLSKNLSSDIFLLRLRIFTLMSSVLLFGLLQFLVFVSSQALTSNAQSSFMLVSGITSKQETCVVGLGSEIMLAPCHNAVSALDGREVWSVSANGQLANGPSKCLGVRGEVKNGADVVLLGCDAVGAGGNWEFSGNGQLKLSSTDLCVTLAGTETGLVNVASKAAASASSTVDAVSHGADAACDDDGASYWASKFDVSDPVTFEINLGSPHTVTSINVDFEHVAQGFSVFVTSDGAHWAETYSTDANVLKHVSVPGGGSVVSSVKLVLRKPHAVLGTLGGHSIYGIRFIAVLSPQLRPVLESCNVAAGAPDARDKYFTSAVSSFDPAIVSKLNAELPSLASADASLSAALAHLSDLLPGLATCRSKPSTSLVRANKPQTVSSLDFDESRAESLLATAKQTIVLARSHLQ